MIKESKLEQGIKKESKLVSRLKNIGLSYAMFWSVPTLGALGGLAYSFYTGDNAMLKDIGCGAFIGAAAEIGLVNYILVSMGGDDW
jgi:hypothetical protein